jgi:YVTN family beta-propeller protein
VSDRGARSRSRRGLAALLLATALATCTNDHPTGPGAGGRGYLSLRPVLAAPVDVAAFGLTIDSLRVAAIRPIADTVVDTMVFFDPNAASLSLSLPVQLKSPSETFILLLELRAGSLVLFSGVDTVQVSTGAPDTSSAATVTLKYSGPGSGITHLSIAPADSVVTLGQTKQFRVSADADGVPVDSFYLSWSTSDTATAPINARGVLRAPNARGAVFVRAITPNGTKDSTRVTFIPVPNAVNVVSGGGQTAQVATRLALPLRVQVKAQDGLGVKGVPVRFQPPLTGSVRDSVVISDSLGFAEDTVTLGTTAGSQSFQASVTGVAAPAVFAATGTPGPIAPAQALVTVSAGTVPSGSSVTLQLQTRDAFNNNLTTGGATVVFTDSGGTSTGAIGTVTDNGNGTYQAPFRGILAGTVTSIKATVNGIAVTTARPTVAVTAGTISPLTSVVSTSSGTVSSGSTATLTVQAKDSVGNLLTAGGSPVLFTKTGGTSTGTIGVVTDHANGTYTATFTADSAGTAMTIGATIGGTPVVSTTTMTVVPGNTVAAQSVITVSADTIPSGGTSTLTLQAKDGAGNNITTGGLTVVFSHAGGTSTGSIAPSPATDNGNGTYTAVFTGVTPGTATTIHATIGGVQVTSTLPTITVTTGVISPLRSIVTSSDSVTTTGGAALTLTLQAKDAGGNPIPKGGATVLFTQTSGPGVSAGVISSTADHGDGTYTATFTGSVGGTPTTIGATIDGTAVSSTPLPKIRVISTVHATDVTSDETWVAGTHTVTAYIRVRNGAKLTIAAGATVRFDPGAGLQIGDTSLNQSGGLILDGTQGGSAPGITLTANTVSPVPGFWKGIEVQQSVTVPPWRRALIEWAGGTRNNPLNVACVLIANAKDIGVLVLDSLQIRECGNAGIWVMGTGGTEIRNSFLFQNTSFGIGVQDGAFKVVNNTIQNHTIGILGSMQGGRQLTAADSIAGNTFPGTQYALSLTAAALRALGTNGITTAISDTLLFTGGRLTADATLPFVAGYVWRATRTTSVDSGATFTVAPGDTVAFDSSAGILVGATKPAALSADGTAGTILFTASGPLPQGWHGIDFHLMSGSGATTNNTFRHVDVDRAGFLAPCFGSECSPIPFGALRFTDSLAPTTVNLTASNIIVRRSISIALDFKRGGTGTVSVVGSQFYQNVQFDQQNPMIRARPGHANQLSISGSDLYHYRREVIRSAFQSSSPLDSVQAPNNWWGDVLGADTGYVYLDSLGRATTQFWAAVVTPFATTPFFPVGPPVGVVTTFDSLLSSVAQNDSVPIHARVVDARGRGVVGQTVTWTPIPASPASLITPTSSPSDLGGRVDAMWKFTTVSGQMTAHANGGGGFTDYIIGIAPGATVTSNWTLDAARSQGTVTGPKAITFTSGNRTGVIVTHSYDGDNNATQFFSSCFDVIGGTCAIQQPGTIDSVHTSRGVDGDTVFFHAIASTPSPFVFRASYNGATGVIPDSVVVTMIPKVAGVKIDRDPYTFDGVQSTPDTALITAICPGGQPNFYCQVEYHAFVVDSGLVPFGNQNARFQWTLLPAAGSPVSVATRGTPANDSALVTALATGFVRLVVKDTGASNFGSDTLPVLVDQRPGFISLTPDVDSVLVGGTTTFKATVIDFAGDTIPGAPVHWRINNAFNPHMTIIDTATPHQVVVRLDSTPFGGEFITAFAVRGPGDTIYGSAEVVNPLGLQIDVGTQPWAIAASTVTHAVYAGHQDGELFRIDGTAGTATHSVTAGSTISAVAVNAVTNRVYAATDSGVVVLSGGILSRVKAAPIAVGKNDQGVQNRQGLTVDSINDKVYVTVIDVAGASPRAVLRRIDGDTNGFSPTNDTPLPDTGNGAVFNPNDGFVYVTIPDSNLVVAVNPATHSVVKRISVGSEPFAIALNPVTNRLYVIDQIFSQNFPYNLYVIDPVAGTVTSTLPTPYQSASLTVDAVNDRVYLGAKFLPYVSAYGGATNTLVGIMVVTPSSDSLFGVSFDAGDGNIYTANYSSNTVTRLKF